jgi:hypothetical protein
MGDLPPEGLSGSIPAGAEALGFVINATEWAMNFRHEASASSSSYTCKC